MIPELELAIARLYEVLGSYALPAEVDMSPYRDPEKTIGALRRKPLRKLTASDLDVYAATAMTTVGDEHLFRCMLPRLLELVAEGDLLTDAEIVVSKLDYGCWRHWPELEQQSVRRFLMAWWADSLNQNTFRMDRAYGVLASIALAEEDLTPYLDCWDEHPAPSATDQLADLFACMWDAEKSVIIHNPFLEQRQPQAEQIRAWLFRPETRQRLEGARGAALERGLSHERLEHYKLTIDTLRVLLPEGAS